MRSGASSMNRSHLSPSIARSALPKLAAALVIEGAIFRLVKGLFDHAARSGFARWTGAWPGEEHPDQT